MKNILLIVMYLLSIKLLYAGQDNTGIIECEVIEKSTKQPLIGVSIIIPGTSLGGATDENGKSIFNNVPSGIYRIEASMIGYEKQIKSEIILSANRVTTVLFELTATAYELNKSIEVTADFFDVDPEKNISIKKLTTNEIKSSPGSAEDVFRIIHTMPGVSTGSMTNSNLIVRGGAPDENLALMDNIEIYSPLHFGRLDASMGTISIINPDLLESVEFSSGGFPAEFGGKLSSLFELKLKEGNSTKFNSDVNLNMAGFGVYADGPLSEKSNIIFSARRGIFDLITRMMKRDVMPRYWDAAGKVTYDLGKANKISLIGFYYRDDAERDKYDPDSHNSKARKYSHLKGSIYGSAVGLNWKYLFSNNGYTLTTASITGNGWRTDAGNQIMRSLYGEDLLEQEFTFKNETVFKITNSFDLKGGVFFKSINSDHYRWTEPDTTETGHIFPADTIRYYPPISHKSGGFFQTILRPSEKMIFTGGIRYDYFDLTKESVVSPRLSFNYKISDKIIFNAAYSKISQDPDAYKIHQHEVNKKLKSAKSDQFILGIDNYIREDIKLSIEGYYKILSNTFVVSDTSKVITNNGSGTVTGVEFFLQKKMSDRLVGSMSYSYSVSKRKDADNLAEYYSDYDRTHNLNLTASYKLTDTWQAGIKFSYCNGTPFTPTIGMSRMNGTHYLVKGEKNSVRLPDYQELDIRIDKKFFFNNWTLNLYLDIWNVYKHKNVIEYIDEVDASGKIIRTPIYDFGIMPIVGISAQF